MIRRIFRRLKRMVLGQKSLVKTRPLPLPEGVSEAQLFEFVTKVQVEGAPEKEMYNYSSHDFKRFIFTYGLAKDVSGKCLELGANPYFTTMILREFTNLKLSLANYFGESVKGMAQQKVQFQKYGTDKIDSVIFDYHHFNVEEDKFPYSDSDFDVVIFAEIIEHLLNDPCKVLREVKRVLKDGGVLILTTPNVARLENVSKLTKGFNIYDPYSGYGPYGRHNREYNLEELNSLLKFEGFKIQESFTADVHFNGAENFLGKNELMKIVNSRPEDLGQYIFIKAVKLSSEIETKKPSWLYRSYPSEELV